MTAYLEKGAQIYNSRMRKGAIGVIKESYSTIPESEIRRIFNYLENYCKIIHGGKIPDNIFRTAAPCSIFQIRNLLINFFEKNSETYESMGTKEILIDIFGKDAYSETLKKYSDKEILEEEIEKKVEDKDTLYEMKTSMEEVDGGSCIRKRKKRRTRKSRSKKSKSRRSRSRL